MHSRFVSVWRVLSCILLYTCVGTRVGMARIEANEQGARVVSGGCWNALHLMAVARMAVYQAAICATYRTFW